MRTSERESFDINRLLGHLHRKKRWLDSVIAGLERAIESPEVRLIEAVRANCRDGEMRWDDLSADQSAQLLDLALRAARKAPATETRESAGSAGRAA